MPCPSFGARRVPLDGTLADGYQRLCASQLPVAAFAWEAAAQRAGLAKRAFGLRGNRGASVNEPLGCAGIGDRRYRRPDSLVERSPSCRRLRGNRGVSVPTVGESRAAQAPLYRRSAILAQPGDGFTDAPRFRRSAAPTRTRAPSPHSQAPRYAPLVSATSSSHVRKSSASSPQPPQLLQPLQVRRPPQHRHFLRNRGT